MTGRVSDAATIDLDLPRGSQSFRAIQIAVTGTIKGVSEEVVTANVPHMIRFPLSTDAEHLVFLSYSDEYGYTLSAKPSPIDGRSLEVDAHVVSLDAVLAAIGGAQ